MAADGHAFIVFQGQTEAHSALSQKATNEMSTKAKLHCVVTDSTYLEEENSITAYYHVLHYNGSLFCNQCIKDHIYNER
jgi:hypothetical protein